LPSRDFTDTTLIPDVPGSRRGGLTTSGPAEWQILLLGLFAGLTIFLGMPFALIPGLSNRSRALLAAIAVGILLFLFVDVVASAQTLIAVPLTSGDTSLVAEYALLLAGGFIVGTLLLVWFERWYTARMRGEKAAVRGPTSIEPTESAFAVDPIQLSTLIAVGIGLHNLSEGLAIGAAYAQGVLALVGVLVIGFAIHNATEGFGVLGPGLMAGRRYSLGRLAALGLVAGGPTFFGTLIGSVFRADAVSVLFFGLAAGAILYVVLQMSRPMLAPATRTVAVVGVLAGFLIGFATDLLITVGGA